MWWRHTTELGWRTPPWFVRIARAIGLVLPEDHDGHHRNPEIEFGDIFRFYDVPARVLLVTLRSWSRAVVRKRSRRSTPVRRAAALKRRAVAKQS